SKEEVKRIVDSFSEPWNIVKYFSSKLIQDFKSIGFSIDFSRQFTTGDLEYNKFIEWQFEKYHEKGYLKKANYPVLYCPKDENAVGEDDISGGDEEKIEVQKFTAIKFKLGEEYLVSATLRPDTFFGITNIFVNPDAEYSIVEVDNKEKIIVSMGAVEKLKLQGKSINEIREIRGEELIGKKAKTPNGKEVPVFPGVFVDPEHGTGIVHSVPAHAPFDHVALEDLKKNKKNLTKYPDLENMLKNIEYKQVIECEGFGEFPAVEITNQLKVMNINEKNKIEKATTEIYKKEHYSGKVLNSEKFSGMSVKEAKEVMGEWIINNNNGFYFYESSSKAHCRCGTKVIVAVMDDQWFLDFNSPGWKELSKKCLKDMAIYPENYRKQFEDVFEWLDKRPCARKRGIGTKLPFNKEWIIESLSDSTMYMAFYTIIKQIRELKMKPEELNLEFFDYVFLGKGKGNEKWEKIRKEFEYWYPNNLRHTAVAHITNHLSFMIFAHTAIFEKKYWPKAFSLNEMLISEGRKMSKSKGNVVMLNEISKVYGADSFRIYICSTSDFGSVLDFRRKDAENAKKNLGRLFLIFEELISLKKEKGNRKESHLTRWMKSTFERTVLESTAALEEFGIREYIQTAFYKMINNMEYFSKKAEREEKKEIADYLTDKWIALLSPAMPHMCEELWEKSGNKNMVSLEKWPEVVKENIDDEVESTENYIKGIIEDITKIKNLLRFPAKKVKLIVASKEKSEKLEKELEKNNAEEVEYYEENIKYFKNNFYKIKNEYWKLDEFRIIRENSGFIEKESRLEVVLENEEESKSEKKGKAFPNKPAIILE
ncbi:MAG: leucine--tRNA ligase, partial [Candidatus ainarchaeum sp.]|nr:leucine--tRNA ligase [Candidatus ainarchaeum sp.]